MIGPITKELEFRSVYVIVIHRAYIGEDRIGQELT